MTEAQKKMAAALGLTEDDFEKMKQNAEMK